MWTSLDANGLLQSLNVNRLLSLVEDGIEAGTFYIPRGKEYFAEGNLSKGVEYLLMAFSDMSRPFIRVHDIEIKDWRRGAEEWCIDFLDRPLNHIRIEPDPGRPGLIRIFEDDKQIQTYEMLGRPEQWQALIKWLWKYGNDRLIRQAAIVARRKASRKYSKPEIPSDIATINPRRKDPTHQHSPDSVLHRPLHQTTFKAQSSKGKGKMVPSQLGMASLSLSDTEGGAGEDHTLQEKDPNGRIAVVNPGDPSDHAIAGSKTTRGDVLMAGAE